MVQRHAVRHLSGERIDHTQRSLAEVTAHHGATVKRRPERRTRHAGEAGQSAGRLDRAPPQFTSLSWIERRLVIAAALYPTRAKRGTSMAPPLLRSSVAIRALRTPPSLGTNPASECTKRLAAMCNREFVVLAHLGKRGAIRWIKEDRVVAESTKIGRAS